MEFGLYWILRIAIRAELINLALGCHYFHMACDYLTSCRTSLLFGLHQTILTEVHVCEQLAQSHYSRESIPAISRSQA